MRGGERGEGRGGEGREEGRSGSGRGETNNLTLSLQMHMLGAVFEEIHRLQTTRYHFKEIKAMIKYLTTGMFI